MTTNAAGEPKEYDYEYYDDTKPASPFVNPYDPSHHQQDLLDGNLAGNEIVNPTCFGIALEHFCQKD